MAFPSKIYKTEALILKRRNLNEADRLVTVFSKDRGKLTLLAKGIRRLTSRKAPNLELFNHCLLIIAKGKNLDLITEAQAINSYNHWRRDLVKVGLAYYFCELVNQLTRENQENRLVFELLKNNFDQIGQLSISKHVRQFEEELLIELGFGIPPSWQKQPGSLYQYIETLIERPLHTPKFLRTLKT